MFPGPLVVKLPKVDREFNHPRSLETDREQLRSSTIARLWILDSLRRYPPT